MRKFFPVDDFPACFFQQPVQLPIFKFVVVPVPHIGFAAISRGKPQSQRNRNQKFVAFYVFQNCVGIQQMLKDFESGKNGVVFVLQCRLIVVDVFAGGVFYGISVFLHYFGKRIGNAQIEDGFGSWNVFL